MAGPHLFLRTDLAASLLPLPLARRAISSHVSNSAQWIQAERLRDLLTIHASCSSSVPCFVRVGLSWFCALACLAVVAYLVRPDLVRRGDIGSAVLAMFAIQSIAARTAPRADLFSTVFFAANSGPTIAECVPGLGCCPRIPG